ncbi:dienelactone hydrolase family protein [Micromonospora sp. DT81.3]|uniref:dienelactone hydrolase family protein n=1 Tax=Micromonospora sp. DT81.3 TaxID=3416523 RepID=UPI003CEB54E9
MKRTLAGIVAALAVALGSTLGPSAAPVAAATAAPTALVAAAAALPVTTTTVTVKIDGRSFSARLVQPSGSAPRTYPVIAFGHGFLQSTAQYAGTLNSIASRGYVVIAPNSEGGFAPDHSRFADDLWRSLRWVRSTQPNASLTLDAVAGHSMGGGAAVVAADRYPDIDSIATLAAAQTTPSATAAAAGIAVGALFVVGSADTVVAPVTTRGIYNAKPSPATFATITGGYHCGFIESTAFLGVGCDRGSISRSAQLSITRGLLGAWFDRAFKGAPVPAVPSGVVVERK